MTPVIILGFYPPTVQPCEVAETRRDWTFGLAHRLRPCFSMQGRAAVTMIRDSDWLYAAITIP